MHGIWSCLAIYIFTAYGHQHELPSGFHSVVKRAIILKTHVLTESQKVQIVDKHNQCRKNVNPVASDMRKMRWNETLAEIATAYSTKCVFKHNYETIKQKKIGENLYQTTRDASAVIDRGITMWNDEKGDYNYITTACSGVCGHYTQVVWARTEQVGCGMTTCDDIDGMKGATIFVCNYFPAGNFVGNKPYQTGAPCSRCPSEYFCDSDGLCSNQPTSLGAGTIILIILGVGVTAAPFIVIIVRKFK